ncbi:MAG: type IV pilus secretin PilQ [Acidobacteria bacterium]|nr:type IV pilus secretin PilQ [Acidobacteriota bacterium]
MNRYKYIYSVIAIFFLSAAAAAQVSLVSIDVNTAGNATTLTLHTSGAFSHKESLPSASLIVVELEGVARSLVPAEVHALHAPGVVSYHVVTSGQGVRVEVAVAPNTTAAFREMPNGLALRIETRAPGRQPQPQPAVTPGPAAPPAVVQPVTLKGAPVPAGSKEQPKPAAPQTAAARPAQPFASSVQASAKPAQPAANNAGPVAIQGVNVSRGANGLDLTITAAGAVEAKSMRLREPDRLVIDVANSIPPAGRSVQVNAPEAHDVRIAQYTAAPPVTRVVVDLGAGVQYNVDPQGNRILVHLRGSSQAEQPPSPSAPKEDAPRKASASADANAAPKAHLPVQEYTVKAKQGEPGNTSAQEPALMAAAFNPQQPAGDSAKAPVPEQSPASSSTSNPQPEPKPAAAPSEPAMPAAHASSPAADFVVAHTQPRGDADPSAATPPMASANLAHEQQQSAQAPHAPARNKYSGAPYSFNLKDADLKDFFRAIAEITGLNIVLDPNVKGTLTLDLHDVPWDQALDIVLENNSLDKQLEGNVLRIATVDTLRKEAEAQLAKEQAQALAVNITTYTHYLSYAHSKDVIQTMKKFLSARGDISADERTNAVIVRDIPSTIPEIQRLLIQLDRKTQQVEIEARVVSATRSFAREIGTQLGFGFGGTVNGGQVMGGGTGAVGQTPTQVGYTAPPPYPTNTLVPLPPSTGTPTVTNSSIPLFSNLGVTAPTSGFGLTALTNNFRLDTVLTMAESRGLLKVLSRPHVVTQNNVKAVVKQGFRVPVVTQAQLGGPPTVTYVDAYLKLTVTPQITAEGTVFLDLEVENTTADFSREVQGNPTLVTQAEVTQVLVSNGGTVQIGGVMLTSNNVNVFQVPLLGDIPILGNVFKHRQVSTSTQELIFFITPKINES